MRGGRGRSAWPRAGRALLAAALVSAASVGSAGAGLLEEQLGVPAEDLAVDRVRLTVDPAYLGGYLDEAAGDDMTLMMPWPVDGVKPELVLPTAPVAPSATPSPLEEALVDLRGVTYEWEGRTKTFGEFMRTTETDGVAFVHDGVLVSEEFENGWSAEAKHQPWSVTKTFVSALVGIALDQGRVGSIADPVDQYVPELAGTVWSGVTIENLLEMESGVHWDESTPLLALNTQVQEWAQLIADHVSGGTVGQTRDEFLVSLPRDWEQGTVFSYNSGNTQVLGWLLETVYDQPFQDILTEQLWQPAGMERPAAVMTDRVGHAVTSQGLYSTIRDLARFGELYRHGGRAPSGAQVVPEEWVAASTTFTERSGGRYGYQVWSTPWGYQASGFEGNKITVAPDDCLTGVRLSHSLGADLRPGGGDPLDPGAYGFADEDMGAEWLALFRAVADHLGGCPT